MTLMQYIYISNIYIYLDITPKAQAAKEKLDNLEFITVKHVCASKDTIKRVKRQSREYEKMFGCHISAKDFYSGCRWNLQLNNKKTNNKNG